MAKARGKPKALRPGNRLAGPRTERQPDLEGQEPRVVGPGFHGRVWALVRQVPRGRVVSYGQIATALGSPRVARQVGFAMAGAANAPEPIPWHRVINAQGRISHRGDTLRAEQQRVLLEREGVVFDAAGAVDLDRYRHAFALVYPDEPIDPDAMQPPRHRRR